MRDTRESAKDFVSNHLNHVKVRFFGNTAVARAMVLEKQAGEQRQGRYVWTDTWVLRNGHWQIVAAEITVLDPGSEDSMVRRPANKRTTPIMTIPDDNHSQLDTASAPTVTPSSRATTGFTNE